MAPREEAERERARLEREIEREKVGIKREIRGRVVRPPDEENLFGWSEGCGWWCTPEGDEDEGRSEVVGLVLGATSQLRTHGERRMF